MNLMALPFDSKGYRGKPDSTPCIASNKRCTVSMKIFIRKKINKNEKIRFNTYEHRKFYFNTVNFVKHSRSVKLPLTFS